MCGQETNYGGIRMTKRKGKGMIRAAAAVLLLVCGLVFAGTAAAEAATKASLDRSILTAYAGEPFTLKISGIRHAAGYEAHVRYVDCSWDTSSVSVTELGGGSFEFVPSWGGWYDIELSVTSDSGKVYSDTCRVSVYECSLKNTEPVVAVGCKTKIEPVNAVFVKAEIISERSKSGTGCIKISSKGKITGLEEGEALLEVTCKSPAGGLHTERINVHVTDPQYYPHEDYYRAGSSYVPYIEGVTAASGIVLESDAPDICAINDEGSISALKAGTCTLTVTVDGKVFTDTITVIDPQLASETLILEKKETCLLGVTGIQEGLTPTFKSSNRKVASVDECGEITAKRSGSAYITVDCGEGTVLYCSVTVSTGTGIEAVRKGSTHLGDPYSQDYRMEEGYFDCSSFAWRSYSEAGINLYDDTYAPVAADLAKYLEADGKAIAYGYVSPDELKPGDLIFYAYRTSGRYMGIDHVAVYYGAKYVQSEDYGDGTEFVNDGLIIHSTSPYVKFSDYAHYIPYDIVMICRPID